jgi:hypothetical protein
MIIHQPRPVQPLAGIVQTGLADPPTAHLAPGVEGLRACLERGGGRPADRAQASPARSDGWSPCSGVTTLPWRMATTVPVKGYYTVTAPPTTASPTPARSTVGTPVTVRVSRAPSASEA